MFYSSPLKIQTRLILTPSQFLIFFYNGASITHIAISFTAARNVETFNAKRSSHHGCTLIFNAFGIHGSFFHPAIFFEERVLIYLTTQFNLFCGYEPSTISVKVISYVHTEMNSLGTIPKFDILSIMLKGIK